MKRWKGRSLWAEMVILMLAPALVACCLVGPIWWPVSAWGQQSSGTGQTVTLAQKQLSPLSAELEYYRQKLYLVLGPMTLTQYDGKTLAVYQGTGDIAIDLRDKKFTVKDGNAQPTSVTAIKKGRKVFVAAGPDEVVLYVPERKGGATDVAH